MEAVRELVERARTAFGDALVAVVVHGSVAWGCWGPGSDIDVLVVVDDRAGLAAFHDLLLELDARAPGNGFELSVLSREAALASRHPIEYLYHFSRGRLVRQPPQDWDLTVTRRDPDLAGHFLVALTTGIAAYGPPVGEVLRRVTDDEFRASVGADVREGCERLRLLTGSEVVVPVYDVLNLARTLAWLTDRSVLSKRDGGRWLLDHDPRWTALVGAALADYADPRDRQVLVADARALAAEVEGLLP